MASPMYALSTAPGTIDANKATPSRVVWRSDDGVEWSPASTLGNDLYLSDLASAGARLFAVGTAPATTPSTAGRRGMAPLVLGWSDDGAKTWGRADVELDVAAIAAKSTSSNVMASDVATGPGGTLAVVALSAVLDVAAVLPSAVRAPHGWAFTANGVDVLGAIRDRPCPDGTEVGKGEPEPTPPQEVYGVACVDGDEFVRTVPPQEAYGVTASFTWAELGVDGDLLRAVRRQPIGFYAPAGTTTFRRVELPAVEPVNGLLVQSTDDGFDLAMTTTTPDGLRSEVSLLQTSDGSAWTSAGRAPGGVQWAQALGRLDGRIAIIGSSEQGSMLVRADGNGGWTTARLSGAVDPDALGDTNAHAIAAAIGPLGAVVAVVLVGEHERPSELTHRLLVTRDGTTWSDTSLDELTGRKIRSVTRVLIAGDRAIVTASVAPEGATDRHEQVVLLGTPD